MDSIYNDLTNNKVVPAMACMVPAVVKLNNNNTCNSVLFTKMYKVYIKYSQHIVVGDVLSFLLLLTNILKH